MIYNLQNENDVFKAKEKFNFMLRNGKTIDLIEKKNTRTTKLNSAIHLLFTIISNELNELCIEFQHIGLKGQVLSSRYTPELVKNHVWRPIQVALFDIESTKKINAEQINEIVDVITVFFAEKGVVIQFPSKKQIDNLIK